MTNVQKNKIDMFEKVQLFFNDYETTLSAFLPLWTIVLAFFGNMTTLKTILQQQQADSKGETKTKDALLKEVVAAIVPLSRKARVWASQQSNLVLESLFDITESDFVLANTNTITLARNILKGLNDNAASLLLFNITAQQLTDAGKSIDSLEASLQTPAQSKNASKAATESLATIISDITKQLRDCDDLLGPEFLSINKDMVLEYENNRYIGNAVNRHTTLTVTVFSDSGKTLPLAGATVTLVEHKRSAVTNVEGIAVIDQFVAGDLTITVSAPGFEEVTKAFSIKRSQHTGIEIVMTAGGIDPQK